MIEFHKCDELENNHKEITVYYGDRIDKWNLNTGYSTIKNIKACPFCGNKLSTLSEPCRFKSSIYWSKISDCYIPTTPLNDQIYAWTGSNWEWVAGPPTISKDIEKLKQDIDTISEMLGMGGHKITDPLQEKINDLTKVVDTYRKDYVNHDHPNLDGKIDRLDTLINCTQKRCLDNHNTLSEQLELVNDRVNERLQKLKETDDTIIRNVNLQVKTIIERLDKIERDSKFHLDFAVKNYNKLFEKIKKIGEDIESNRDD
jgi:hypothetical protein